MSAIHQLVRQAIGDDIRRVHNKNHEKPLDEADVYTAVEQRLASMSNDDLLMQISLATDALLQSLHPDYLAVPVDRLCLVLDALSPAVVGDALEAGIAANLKGAAEWLRTGNPFGGGMIAHERPLRFSGEKVGSLWLLREGAPVPALAEKPLVAVLKASPQRSLAGAQERLGRMLGAHAASIADVLRATVVPGEDVVRCGSRLPHSTLSLRLQRLAPAPDLSDGPGL